MIQHQIINSYGNFNYNAFIYHTIRLQPHFHGNYELIYVMEGTTEVSVNGITELLEQGELLLIPPYGVHSLYMHDAKTWVGVFSEDFVSVFSERNRYVRYGKFRCTGEQEQFLLRNLFFEGQPERYLHMACLYIVCSECVKNAAVLSTRQDHQFMHEVIDFISENLNTELTMQAAADHLNYEYHYFSTLFHQCFGMNFRGYLNIFRFEQACRLLSDRSGEITDICSLCGFGSIRNFNRVFKNLSGVTPGEYRKQCML